VKDIGKPCMGKSFARFDEEGPYQPALYSTQSFEGMGSKVQNAHERYLEVWYLLQKRNETMSRTFDGHSRSKSMLQLHEMRKLGLVDDEDVVKFDPAELYEI